VDSLMEQVSQAETKNKSPFKRRSGLTDEEMGRGSHSHQAVIHTFTHSLPPPAMLATPSAWTVSSTSTLSHACYWKCYMYRSSEHTIALILLHEVQANHVDMYKPLPHEQWRQSHSWLYAAPIGPAHTPKLLNNSISTPFICIMVHALVLLGCVCFIPRDS